MECREASSLRQRSINLNTAQIRTNNSGRKDGYQVFKGTISIQMLYKFQRTCLKEQEQQKLWDRLNCRKRKHRDGQIRTCICNKNGKETWETQTSRNWWAVPGCKELRKQAGIRQSNDLQFERGFLGLCGNHSLGRLAGHSHHCLSHAVLCCFAGWLHAAPLFHPYVCSDAWCFPDACMSYLWT